jgi:Tetracyclin repressor-like, C-terminal domain
MSRNSELAARARDRLQTERRSRGMAILRRAIARREIVARSDRELFNDAVAAMIYWQMVVTGVDVSHRYLRALTPAILRAIGKGTAWTTG